jgi:hypothetical protein
MDSSANVFAGGNYTTVKDDTSTSISANYSAQWNPVTQRWSRLGSVNQNGTNARVWNMALDNSNQILYVGGQLTTVSDASNLNMSANYVASWNIASERWYPLGITSFNGTNNTVCSLIFDNSDNRLYVGGAFISLNDRINRNLTVSCIAYWNPVTELWNTFGTLNSIPYVFVLDNSGGNLYVGGRFSSGTDSTSKPFTSTAIATYKTKTNTWDILPSSTTKNGVNTTVKAITVDNSNQVVYVGGNFWLGSLASQ